jgi:hypothetical protein
MVVLRIGHRGEGRSQKLNAQGLTAFKWWQSFKSVRFGLRAALRRCRKNSVFTVV